MLEALALNMAVPIEPALIAGLPTHEVTLTQHGETQVCTGPLLADVMAKLGAPSRGDMRGSALMMTVVVEARDRYRVALSLGELDPLLGKAEVVLADRCNGAALTEEDGPFRLAVAGETRGARSVRQVVSVRLAEVR
ncbi:MAG: molybdopterin-binding oxidoreductase [Sphingomonadales bacterium]|nr:MAG: molybdopterin-binding oxidoreductase [Sphingomonadales bacterium]